MEITLPDVLVCGVRKMGKDERPTYLLDWYKDGAKSSFIEAERVQAYTTLIGKRMTFQLRIEERRDGKGVNYRILKAVSE